MQRTVVAFVVLVLALYPGCSRQKPPHLGEWESNDNSLGATWFNILCFYEDGTVKRLSGADPLKSSTANGRYRIDYSRNPIEIDINVDGKETLHGIIRFLGDDKSLMQMLFDPEGEKRPAVFEQNMRLVTWTKKRNM